MALVRCTQCGRVADGVLCFACGYEWPRATRKSSSSIQTPTAELVSDSALEVGDLFGGGAPPPRPPSDSLLPAPHDAVDEQPPAAAFEYNLDGSADEDTAATVSHDLSPDELAFLLEGEVLPPMNTPPSEVLRTPLPSDLETETLAVFQRPPGLDVGMLFGSDDDAPRSEQSARQAPNIPVDDDGDDDLGDVPWPELDEEMLAAKPTEKQSAPPAIPPPPPAKSRDIDRTEPFPRPPQSSLQSTEISSAVEPSASKERRSPPSSTTSKGTPRALSDVETLGEALGLKDTPAPMRGKTLADLEALATVALASVAEAVSGSAPSQRDPKADRTRLTAGLSRIAEELEVGGRREDASLLYEVRDLLEEQ